MCSEFRVSNSGSTAKVKEVVCVCVCVCVCGGKQKKGSNSAGREFILKASPVIDL